MSPPVVGAFIQERWTTDVRCRPEAALILRQSIFEGFAACVADFGAHERAQLFVENARRIYRIGV
jgi:hypothetical protein